MPCKALWPIRGTGISALALKSPAAVIDAAEAADIGYVTAQDLRRSFATIAARRIPDPAEAAFMTGHSLDVWVRHYVGRGGPAQRADARARLLEGGFGTVEYDDENEVR
jgi:hypothetical protein